MTAEAKKLVVIGTSGSHDYLKDTTGGRRYWPVRVPAELGAEPLLPEERAVVDKLVAMSSGAALASDDEAVCDGIHDEGAPSHYLCTRCFPDLVDRAFRGDLVDPEENDEYEDRRDDGGETE